MSPKTVVHVHTVTAPMADNNKITSNNLHSGGGGGGGGERERARERMREGKRK